MKRNRVRLVTDFLSKYVEVSHKLTLPARNIETDVFCDFQNVTSHELDRDSICEKRTFLIWIQNDQKRRRILQPSHLTSSSLTTSLILNIHSSRFDKSICKYLLKYQTVRDLEQMFVFEMDFRLNSEMIFPLPKICLKFSFWI